MMASDSTHPLTQVTSFFSIAKRHNRSVFNLFYVLKTRNVFFRLLIGQKGTGLGCTILYVTVRQGSLQNEPSAKSAAKMSHCKYEV